MTITMSDQEKLLALQGQKVMAVDLIKQRLDVGIAEASVAVTAFLDNYEKTARSKGIAASIIQSINDVYPLHQLNDRDQYNIQEAVEKRIFEWL